MMLYLIRHASAAQRGPNYPDDSQRPLLDKGKRQSLALLKLLKTLDAELDRLFSSPYLRAVQTAQALEPCLPKGRSLEHLLNLTHDNYDLLLGELSKNLKKTDQTIALVGHEPYMSELAAVLLTGETRLAIDFRKAAVMRLTGKLLPGQLKLEFLVPAAIFKHLS
jgi:phosphohistidine phosphatase